MLFNWFEKIRSTHIYALAFFLSLPALFSGYLGDDYIHHALLSPDISIPKANDWSLFGLFSWVDATPERNHVLMDLGVIPWWTYEGMRYQFWRPLAELTHWFDHRMLHAPMWLMHLHSAVWYLALGFLLNKLFRRSGMSTRATLVALFIYLLDSTHGFTLGWIANRNALIAGVFGVLCLLKYLDWQQSEKNTDLGFSVLLLLCSLLSAEIGISITCYLGAHALILGKRGPIKSVLSLWPYMLVSVTWWAAYKIGHFGANNSDVNYIDPVESPLIFLGNLGMRIPVLLFAQFGIVPAEIYGFSPPPFLSYLLTAIGFLAVVAFILYPLLRASKWARYWALGMGFATLPICTTIPSDRNLLLVGIGASALLGLLFDALLQNALGTKRSLLAKILLSFHLLISPLLLPLTSYSSHIWSTLMGLNLAVKMPVESKDENILLLGVPMPIALGTTPQLFARGMPLPGHLWLLSSLALDFKLVRTGETSFDLFSEDTMVSGIEEALRDVKRHPLAVGDEVALSGLRINVKQVTDKGYPTALALNFTPDALAKARLIVFKNFTYEATGWPQQVGEAMEIKLKPPVK